MNKIMAIITFVTFIICGCDQLTPCNSKELQRISSPDNLLDAVLVETDCGATTSFVSTVYIVPKYEEVSNDDVVFKADNVKDLTLYWAKNNFLEIRYGKARIFNFTNFWHSKDVGNFEYVVNVLEKPNKQ